MMTHTFALLLDALPPGAPPPSPGGAPAPAPGLGGGLAQLAPMALIFLVFYFMIIRPSQKKQREQQDWLKTLKKGDDVVTSAGMLGKIFSLTDEVVTLELGDKVRMRVLRSSISGPAPGTSSEPASDGK
jgi:preprotein translocase subunit YajC